MANHGFIKTKKPLKPSDLKRLLEEINQERFCGKFKISDGGWTEGKSFTVEIVEDSPATHRHFWLASPRKIEHRHGPGGDFCWWVETIFANDMAVKLNGKLSDEGVGGSWPGEPGKWPTMKSYVEEQWEHVPDRSVTSKFIKMALNDAAKARPDLEREIGL